MPRLYESIETKLAPHRLSIMGGLHEETSTLLLIGPTKDFWPYFKSQPENKDADKDPIDRWSTRVLTDIANSMNAEALFPFGGPPYQPFISWATQSGHTWTSPITLLVHDEAGLFVSFRGALRFNEKIDLPQKGTRPCATCTHPCKTACPVNALTAEGYDTTACHAYLDTKDGQDCLTHGCKARRACPISQTFKRPFEQSAHHMAYFHPRVGGDLVEGAESHFRGSEPQSSHKKGR